MANIVISNTGGFFSATTTWVGGVVPVAADTISASTTSGNLIVSDSRNITAADFGLYTGTLELRNQLLCGVPGAGSSITIMTLSSGMTITAPLGSIGQLGAQPGQGIVGRTIRTNGCVIPFFFVGQNQNLNYLTLLDNLTCITYTQGLNNNNCVLAGFQMNITNWVVSGGSGAGRLNGTTKVYLNGANCSWSANTAINNSYIPVGLPIYIDTPGTLTISGGISVNPYSTTSGIYYIRGTIAGEKILRINIPSIASAVNTIYDLDLNGSGTWTTIGISNGSWQYQSTINLISNLNFTNLYLLPDTSYNAILAPQFTRFPVRFTGAGALKGGGLYTNTIPYFNIPMSANTNNSGTLQLNTGVVHTLGYISSIGGDDTSFNRVLIRSISGGTQATLNFTGNTQSVFFTNFTDINASGGNTIYTYSGTTSNTQNILPITSYVPTSSNTFLNG